MKPKISLEMAQVLERLADGELLAEIAEDVDVKRTTLYMRFQASPELADAYARAREHGLHVRGERLVAMTRRELPKLQTGGIDPAAVSQLKLEVDAEKWTLAKLLPKVFGDKVQQEHSGSVGVTIAATPTDESL